MTRFTDALKATLKPDQLLSSWPERLVYERDANGMHTATPSLVLLPDTVEQVRQLVCLHREFGLPLTARGAGTGQSGGALASGEPAGSIISTARLNKMIAINAEQRWACVEPGVRNGDLNALVAPYGLQFAPDPSSQAMATLGGNVAENAGGIHCVRYGVTRDHVLGLELINGEGELIQLGGPAAQSSNFALSDLLCGSEGTLGIITRLWVKLIPLPAYRCAVQVSFTSMQQAMRCVQAIIMQGLVPAALECIDKLTIQCVNKAFGVGLPQQAEAMLLIELDALQEKALDVQLHQLTQLVEALNPLNVEIASEPDTIQKLWAARKGAAASYGLLAPSFYVLDCVVPRPKLVQALDGIEAVGQQFDLTLANVFHAGDGNLHPHLMFEPSNTEQKARVLLAAEQISKLCLSLGGTLSGEHGIGVEKQAWMPWQFSAVDLTVMRRVSEALDTKGLMNPGKMLPVSSCCGTKHQKAQAQVKGLSGKALATQGLWI